MFRNKIATGLLCLGIGFGSIVYPTEAAANVPMCINTNIVGFKDYHKVKPVTRTTWLNGNYTIENRLAYTINQIGCAPNHLETVEGKNGNEYDYWKFVNLNNGFAFVVLTGTTPNGPFVVLGKEIQQ